MWVTRRALPTYPQAQHQQKRANSLALKVMTARQESDCERVHAVEGLYAPHTTKAKPDDTLPPRHSAPPNAPARNMNKVDRSRATKTGHIELCSGSTANGTARQVRRASHEGQREGLEADIGQSVAALARRRLTQVRQTSADRTQLGDQLPNDTHVDDRIRPPGSAARKNCQPVEAGIHLPTTCGRSEAVHPQPAAGRHRPAAPARQRQNATQSH